MGKPFWRVKPAGTPPTPEKVFRQEILGENKYKDTNRPKVSEITLAMLAVFFS